MRRSVSSYWPSNTDSSSDEESNFAAEKDKGQHNSFHMSESSSSLVKSEGKRVKIESCSDQISTFPAENTMSRDHNSFNKSESSSLVRSQSCFKPKSCSCLVKSATSIDQESYLKEFFLPELVTNILSRACVKSIFNASLVCKGWLNMVSDETFIQDHLKNSSLKSQILHLGKKNTLEVFSLSHLFSNPHPAQPSYTMKLENCSNNLIGSSNGIACMMCYQPSVVPEAIDLWFQLANPATKTISGQIGRFSWNLFHKNSNLKCAFGFDRCSGKYKIITMMFQNPASATTVKVLNVGENVYHDAANFPCFHVLMKHSRLLDWNESVNVDNVIAWLGFHPRVEMLPFFDFTGKGVHANDLLIVLFDLDAESFKILPTPAEVDVFMNCCPGLSVLEKSLCFSHEWNHKYLLCWKRVNSEDLWMKSLCVSYEMIPRAINSTSFNFQFKPMYCEEGLLILADRQNRTGVCAINLENNKARTSDIIRWYCSTPYFETLVLEPLRVHSGKGKTKVAKV